MLTKYFEWRLAIANMRIEKEKKISFLMIDLYCKKKHNSKKNCICDNCLELKKYVEERLSKCPYKENKSFCSNCKIHCYNAKMQNRIKEVMRFSGPRIIFYHPILAVKHLIQSKKEKKKNGKE